MWFYYVMCLLVLYLLQVYAPRCGGGFCCETSRLQRPGASVFLLLCLLQQAGGRPVCWDLNHDITVSQSSVYSLYVMCVLLSVCHILFSAGLWATERVHVTMVTEW